MEDMQQEKIRPGLLVEVVLDEDQGTGKLTPGMVQEVLSSTEAEPIGAEVRLVSGKVGTVQKVVSVYPYTAWEV